jgi:SSS family solute:Na+ symporter
MFSILAGFTSLLLLPGLKGNAADQSFVTVLQRYFPPWVVGLVCGAGCLAALLPASSFMLGAGTLVSRNVLGHTRWVRPTMLACAGLSLVLWMVAKASLVDYLLLVFNGVAQLAPPIVLGLIWPRVTVWGAASGLVAGIAIAASTVHASTGAWGINVGAVAVIMNLVVCVVVTMLMPVRQSDPAATP